MLQSITKYNRFLQSFTESYRVLKGITECYTVLQSTTEYYRVLLSITEYYRVSQSIAKYYKVLQRIQSITKTKKNLLHLIGPIFGLVFIGLEFTFLINLLSVRVVRVSVDVTLAFEGVNSKLAHIVSEVYIRVDKKALATA